MALICAAFSPRPIALDYHVSQAQKPLGPMTLPGFLGRGQMAYWDFPSVSLTPMNDNQLWGAGLLANPTKKSNNNPLPNVTKQQLNICFYINYPFLFESLFYDGSKVWWLVRRPYLVQYYKLVSSEFLSNIVFSSNSFMGQVHIAINIIKPEGLVLCFSPSW